MLLALGERPVGDEHVTAAARSTVAVSGGCRPPVNTQAPAARISASTASISRMIGSRTSGGGGSPSGW